MIAETQNYASPTTYQGPDGFGPPAHSTEESKDFFGSIEPRRTNEFAAALENERSRVGDSPFWDFDLSTNADSSFRNQFSSTPGASGMTWSNDQNLSLLSPPHSAVYSPRIPWSSYPYQNQLSATVNTNFENGQITPPEDDRGIGSFSGSEDQDRPRILEQELKKRRRNTSLNNGELSSQSVKRSRRLPRALSGVETRDKPEDVKRSKFLERNRVAASKCRQKKKEWTQNLENRARELQKSNSMLRLDVESYRQEIQWLKGEMLKHSSCDCEQIQSFMKSAADSFIDATEDGLVLKREQSPIESMPGSPESLKPVRLREIVEISPAAETADTSLLEEENTLEALLSRSIKSDTNDAGIVSGMVE